MHDPKAEAQRWLLQAQNDLAFARHAFDGAFFHQACFNAQQAAEKALKAVLYAGGARSVIGHSVAGLLSRVAGDHPELEALRDQAAELDLFYIAARYPNGLIEGMPYQAFTRAQAERALSAGASFLAAVEGVLSASDDRR